MTRYKVRETFYGQAGRQYIKDQTIDAGAYNALSEGEKWWFTPVEVASLPTQPSWAPPPQTTNPPRPTAMAAVPAPPPNGDRLEVAAAVADRSINALAQAHSQLQEARATMADAHATFLETVEAKFKTLEEKLVSEFELIKGKLHDFFHPHPKGSEPPIVPIEAPPAEEAPTGPVNAGPTGEGSLVPDPDVKEQDHIET